jgi:hypothetical protein
MTGTSIPTETLEAFRICGANPFWSAGDCSDVHREQAYAVLALIAGAFHASDGVSEDDQEMVPPITTLRPRHHRVGAGRRRCPCGPDAARHQPCERQPHADGRSGMLIIATGDPTAKLDEFGEAIELRIPTGKRESVTVDLTVNQCLILEQLLRRAVLALLRGAQSECPMAR